MRSPGPNGRDVIGGLYTEDGADHQGDKNREGDKTGQLANGPTVDYFFWPLDGYVALMGTI